MQKELPIQRVLTYKLQLHTALCKMILACLNFHSSPANLPFRKNLQKFSQLSRNDFTQLCIPQNSLSGLIRKSISEKSQEDLSADKRQK